MCLNFLNCFWSNVFTQNHRPKKFASCYPWIMRNTMHHQNWMSQASSQGKTQEHSCKNQWILQQICKQVRCGSRKSGEEDFPCFLHFPEKIQSVSRTRNNWLIREKQWSKLAERERERERERESYLRHSGGERRVRAGGFNIGERRGLRVIDYGIRLTRRLHVILTYPGFVWSHLVSGWTRLSKSNFRLRPKHFESHFKFILII